MTIPNCRTCKDTGLIPAEYGVQPCPMCKAWERRRENAWESRVRVSDDSAADRLIAVLIVAIAALLTACWWLLPGGRA